MKWDVPAKTFLVGEYSALAGKSAIVLTTSPYFSLSINDSDEPYVFHPDSPAGRWWQQPNRTPVQLSWHDPYFGRGGLGASSAQFVASYLASCYLEQRPFDRMQLLKAYEACAWSGIGLKPSGYDVIAQSLHGCVYINKEKGVICPYSWPFEKLSFVLVHTGIKLATHEHLQQTTLPHSVERLSAIVESTKHAFEANNEEQLVTTINHYHQELLQSNLVAKHSCHLIEEIKAWSEVLAIKGCGALGADVLLLVCRLEDKLILSQKLQSQRLSLLASEENLKNNCENS